VSTRNASRRSHGAPRHRKLIWAQRNTTLAFTANSSWQNVDLLQEFKALVGASQVGVTVMRTHLLVVPGAVSAGDSFFIGLHVDDASQLNASPTTNVLVANARDNPGDDWMWNSRYVADSAGFYTPAYGGVRLDVRSKRRMEEVSQTFFLQVVQDAVATPTKSYFVMARTLLALP